MKKLSIKLLRLLREQCKKDQEVSEHIAALVPDSTTPVYTTSLVDKLIKLFFNGEITEYYVYEYLLEIDDDNKAEKFLKEKIDNDDICITFPKKSSEEV